METKPQSTALMVLNTDDIRTINFLNVQGIYSKEWNEEKTSYRSQLLKRVLIAYCIKVNFTKQTVEINDRLFKVKYSQGNTYDFQKNVVGCQSLEGLYKHFKKASSREDVFHIRTADLLQQITN